MKMEVQNTGTFLRLTDIYSGFQKQKKKKCSA